MYLVGSMVNDWRLRHRCARSYRLLFTVPWVFVLTYLTGGAAQLILPMTIHSPGVSRIMRVGGVAPVAVVMVVAFSTLGIFNRMSTT
jgi:hypothetical protein